MSDEAKAAQAAMRQEYDKQKAEREKMTAAAHQFPTPTPTQEENDLFALGLLNPDEKQTSGEPEGPQADPRRASPGRPVMPHSAAQPAAHPPEQRPAGNPNR